MIRSSFALPLLAAIALPAGSTPGPPSWTVPTAPFHVVGPIWYVGTQGLAAYLIKTRDGAILLDGTMAENVPAIERNIAAVGVPLRSVRVLLNSHAHFDHAAGLAQLKKDTGAKLIAGAGDRAALETGVPPGEVDYGVIRFPAVPVARAIRDGDTVKLGEVTLTAHATPGHTPGNTGWTMRVVEGGRPLEVLFPGSLTVAGNRLVGNMRYPGIVADFRRSFARMAALNPDVVLPAHPEGADVIARGQRAARGDKDAFLAPGLWAKTVAAAKVAFEGELAKQGAVRQSVASDWVAPARPAGGNGRPVRRGIHSRVGLAKVSSGGGGAEVNSASSVGFAGATRRPVWRVSGAASLRRCAPRSTPFTAYSIRLTAARDSRCNLGFRRALPRESCALAPFIRP